MAPHSSTLAWKIPWMEEPGRLQSMGSLRVSTTERLHFHFSLSCIGEGNGNPLQYSCLENPKDRGAWWAAIYGVVQSQTWLKRLSSSSRLVIAFLPRSKRLLISWLQSPPAGILEPKKIKSVTLPLFVHLFAMKWWDRMTWSSFSECWALSQLFHSPLSLSSRGSLVPLHFMP